MYLELRNRLERKSIPGLDGIRALSVALVVFYHAGVPVSGPLGVLVFFVLSGFLITWLLLKEQEAHGKVSLSGFYWRRVLRIFPAFYCFWIVAVALRLVQGGRVPWPQAWSSFFYYSNYYHGLVRPDDQFLLHTWSLAVEEQFYLCWPLLFLAFAKSRRNLAVVTAVIIVIVGAHRTVLCLAGTPYQYTRYTFDCRADSLLWGCLAAIAVREGWIRGFWDWSCSRPWMALITGATVVGIAHGRVPDVVALTVLPPLAALLICQLVTVSDSWLWCWLDSAPARYVGRISYPLYLYHGIGLGLAKRLILPRVITVGLVAGVAVAVASASYYVVEKPALAFKNARPGALLGRLRVLVASLFERVA